MKVGRLAETNIAPLAEPGPTASLSGGPANEPSGALGFEDRFLRLLEKRTALYTMGDSTSVPAHVAVDLMLSVCFVLGIDPDDPQVPDELLSADLDEVFERRLSHIAEQVERVRVLWRDACLGMPLIPNIALRDTLAEIGRFADRYDYRSMAHDIPCSIDYPLCHPVPEWLAGVEYVTAYLQRLLREIRFLGRFETDACLRVLAGTCPDYRGLVINLYEPVATNAIGLVMTGAEPWGLEVSESQRKQIAGALGSRTTRAREKAVCDAATQVFRTIGLPDAGDADYLRALVPELMPRIEVGLSRGDLSGVFVSGRSVGA